MGNNQCKGGCCETIADRQFVDVGGSDDFVLEVNQRLPKIRIGNDSRVALANQDRHDLPRAHIQNVEPLPGNFVENLIDHRRALFRNESLRQGAGVEVEGVHSAYSSRMAMMPWLNSFVLGLIPVWSSISRSFFAPTGFPQIPTVCMNLFQPAKNSLWPALASHVSSSPRERSSASAAMPAPLGPVTGCGIA